NWLQETDYQIIEEQLQSNSANGSSALEHDETYLYPIHAYYSHPIELNISDPLPLDVVVIDVSILDNRINE
ncbi:unnamed protein product, partial [Rotaria sp. Silwood2]